MFDLTSQEKKVLIALGAFAILGLAVLGYRTYIARPELEVVSSSLKSSGYETLIRQKRVVNVNTADAKTIETLPSVGPKLAADIIAYRNAHGSFICKEDIKKVRGIGPKKFEDIKEYIALE